MFNKTEKGISRGEPKPNAHRFDKIDDVETHRLSDVKKIAGGKVVDQYLSVGAQKGQLGRQVPRGDVYSNEELNRMDQIRWELQNGRRTR